MSDRVAFAHGIARLVLMTGIILPEREAQILSSMQAAQSEEELSALPLHAESWPDKKLFEASIVLAHASFIGSGGNFDRSNIGYITRGLQEIGAQMDVYAALKALTIGDLE